ncbi:leucyl aminopeptidase [Nocardioides anomalus]|uniref:Probable cytosol aminopeptidase n=1 Tax=Nocardioides anomalus TaxID=2712223 RepID=A0A6G6WED4_9ACTN|nr:leucyl aminopeptidase [Nocardioides anomalus]QIG43602.1 leucyl aminopeptidase [Nocardioides anomalus]
MSTYTLRNASPAKTRCDAVVVGVVQGGKGAKGGPLVALGGEEVAHAYGRTFRPLLASLGFTGKVGEVAKIPTAKQLTSPLLVVIGLGKVGEDGVLDPRVVRRAAGVAARSVSNAASVALALPADTPELVRAVTEGFVLGGYTYTAYKKKADDDKPRSPGEVVVLSPSARKKEHVQAFEDAQLVAEHVATTRDWVNTPPGDLTPPSFAAAVEAAVKDASKGRGAPKLTVTVRDERALAELGCGGILGVGGGSAAPPRLVEIGYAPRGAKTHLALVGKGITFDSGGLTIKPAASMNDMKSDMAGAAAVVQATLAIARLGLPIRVTAFAPMAENMVSGDSMRPGDVLTMYGGTTVEVTNTDAEGRLVLGDALVMATERQPDVILDVATLTGHMVVALGDKVAGVMGSQDVVDAVLAAAGTAGEEQWPMPIPEAMDERIHSSRVADLAQHDWVRWGGGLFAAAFLREFTGGLPWAHLDIAGPGYNSGGPYGHVTSGGTGFAVTTLVDYARALAG